MFEFSRIEARDLIISALALAIIFAYPHISIYSILIYMSSVSIGFLSHELAHRTMAKRFGCHTNYKMWPKGLLIAFLLTVASGGRFLFAAPGAVEIRPGYRRISRTEIGLISLAGPLTNLALVFLFLILIPISPIFHYGAIVNAMLATFNMLIIPPLDGAKIFSWNKKVWSLAFITSLVLFMITTSI